MALDDVLQALCSLTARLRRVDLVVRRGCTRAWGLFFHACFKATFAPG
jgi:hypothetical protein